MEQGWRLVINDGVHGLRHLSYLSAELIVACCAGCQSVYHLHIHVVGGCQLSWSEPPMYIALDSEPLPAGLQGHLATGSRLARNKVRA